MLLVLYKWDLMRKRPKKVPKQSRISIRKQRLFQSCPTAKELPDDQTNRKTLFPMISWIFLKVSIFGTFLVLISLHLLQPHPQSLILLVTSSTYFIPSCTKQGQRHIQVSQVLLSTAPTTVFRPTVTEQQDYSLSTGLIGDRAPSCRYQHHW